MEQQHVVGLDCFPQVFGADRSRGTCGGQSSIFRSSNPAGRQSPSGPRPPADRRFRTLVLAKPQPLGQPVPHARIGIGRDRQPDGARRRRDNTTSSIACSRSSISSSSCEHDVGVAGDAKRGRGLDLAVREQGRQVRRNHIFHPRQMGVLLGGQGHQPRQLAGHGHDHNPLVPSPASGEASAGRPPRPPSAPPRATACPATAAAAPVPATASGVNIGSISREKYDLQELPLLARSIGPAARDAAHARPIAQAPPGCPPSDRQPCGARGG